jgi:Putative auto-transporter adhesin, head GIN domain
MRQSQIVVLSAFGLIALYMILMAGLARVALSQASSGERAVSDPGPETSETLDLAGFRRIDLRAAWRVTVGQGDAWRVEISYPQNLRDNLRVRVDGDALLLGYETRDWSVAERTRERFIARITMPALAGVDLAGVGRVDFAGFSGDRLAVDMSGAGEINGRGGRYDTLEVDISGVGGVDVSGLTVRNADVELSGAGSASLTLDGGTLSGNLSGAGVVRYAGSVGELRISTSGAGRVVPLD